VIEPHVVAAFFEGVAGLRAEVSATTDELRRAEEAFRHADLEVASFRDNESLADLGNEYVKGLHTRIGRRGAALDALDQARTQAGIAELPDATELEALWPDLGVAERRHLLQAGLDAVFIRRGRVPIEDRTRVLWRGQGPADLPGPGKRLGAQAFVWDDEREAGMTAA
jgi:hypothetical protein